MCLLSIIIPNYNNAKLLNRCLDSILHAKTQAIEVIVIDDGSTDDSIKCLQNYEDERLKYYRQENQGVSAARNKGLSYVSGIYVTFCDADDFYLENAIDDLVSIMEREKEDLDILAFNVFQEQLEKEGRRVCRKWPNALSEKICVTDSQRIDCGAYMRFVVQNSNMNSVFNKIYKY